MELAENLFTEVAYSYAEQKRKQNTLRFSSSAKTPSKSWRTAASIPASANCQRLQLGQHPG